MKKQEIKINSTELVEIFLDLVKIDSESGNEQQIREHIIEFLKVQGVESIVDQYGNLIAKIPGEGSPILLTSHMDTVKPGRGVVPIIDNDIIHSSGDTILGADDKAGIASILYTIKYIADSKTHRALEVVFTREEEVGCIGAKNLDYSLISAKECLVLDHNAVPGKIVIGAPHLTDLEITITGRSSHASRPENGINSIVVAAVSLSKLKIGRIDHETTSNVGIINGGVISNGVPEVTTIRMEVRSHNLVKHDKLVKRIEEIFKSTASKYGAELRIEAKAKIQGYSIDKKCLLYKSVKKSFTTLGIHTFSEKIGGASDANVFNAQGILAIPLGSGGEHAHTNNESIYIAELEDLAKFLQVLTKS